MYSLVTVMWMFKLLVDDGLADEHVVNVRVDDHEVVAAACG